jgi:Transposase IS4
MFPPSQLNLMHRLMIEEIQKIAVANNVIHQDMTKGELLKFFGILILSTRFEFSARASLWSTTAPYKYVPAPAFGKKGMSRHRFDLLFRCLRFGEQPSVQPPEMSHKRFRWLLVDDFVTNFNTHREATFVPGTTICVDESVSRWYGLGGGWISVGLPHYLAIDRKPDNGCEIQDAACGESGVIIRLKIVTAEEDGIEASEDDEQRLTHGCRVTKYLVGPWNRTNRIVCGDSYFSSVDTATELKSMGLRFIGVGKTATRKFPMQWLSSFELWHRGDQKGLVHCGPDGQSDMMAFVWMDRDRRYFIANCSSLAPGRPHVRQRWRQVDGDDARQVELTIPTPKACEVYYDTCATIDKSNRHRKDTLKLERKVETNNWATRVGTTILGIIFVDRWLT